MRDYELLPSIARKLIHHLMHSKATARSRPGVRTRRSPH
jgi:hypothetical protein